MPLSTFAKKSSFEEEQLHQAAFKVGEPKHQFQNP